MSYQVIRFCTKQSARAFAFAIIYKLIQHVPGFHLFQFFIFSFYVNFTLFFKFTVPVEVERGPMRFR